MRVALGVEYKGGGFSGWQSQVGARTVQDCLEAALARVADRPVRVTTAGRTDAGVHAAGQVVHFDTDAARAPRSWLRGANSYLPEDVRVWWAGPVADDFSARFSALERTYRYIIHCARTRPAVLGELCAWTPHDLALAPMRDAAAGLAGRHDFSAFRAAGCQAASPVRTITRVEMGASGPWRWLDVTADAFLQHMVRNMAGSLMLIGRGERPPHWLAEVLEGRDRRRAGAAAPPAGLYLTGVRYPADAGAPEPPEPFRFW